VRKAVAGLARQSPALVVATIALCVALTGTAVATTAVLITGKQIKDGSVTGADIKNGSLGVVDLSKSARGARGAQGIQGVPGPQGAKGDTGAAGVAGSARAYALGGGDLCPGAAAPPSVTCPALRGKGIASIVRVGLGLYCVTATGIDAASSVAIVTPATGGSVSRWVARWVSSSGACPSSDFAVETTLAGTLNVRNVTDDGPATVAQPSQYVDSIRFVIAIL
jgi:hypothetical protein